MEATLEGIYFVWQMKTLLLFFVGGAMFFIILGSLLLSLLVLTFRLCYDNIDITHWYFSAQKALRDNIGNTTIRWPGQAEVLAWKSLLLR